MWKFLISILIIIKVEKLNIELNLYKQSKHYFVYQQAMLLN
jgi:hypothetical protein